MAARDVEREWRLLLALREIGDRFDAAGPHERRDLLLSVAADLTHLGVLAVAVGPYAVLVIYYPPARYWEISK